MPDTRTKREKLQDMAERGTPAEQEAARRALDRLPPEPVGEDVTDLLRAFDPTGAPRASGYRPTRLPISPFPDD